MGLSAMSKGLETQAVGEMETGIKQGRWNTPRALRGWESCEIVRTRISGISPAD